MKIVPRVKTTKGLLRFIYLFFVSCLVVIHVRLYRYAFDDAFIHFRVVRNIFETGYPFYNINEIVKVSTSSGWIVFLTPLFGIAKLFKIENIFPLLVSMTNAFILLLGVCVYTRMVETLLNKQLSITKRLIFQITFVAILLPSSIGLMESPLGLLIAGLGIYFLLLARPLGFTLLGCAVYLRVELLVLVLLASLFVIFQKQFRLYQIIGYSILGFIPFIFFDLYYFYTILPHSIIAKPQVYSLTTYHTFSRILFYSLQQIQFDRNTPIYLGIASITYISIFITTGWVTFQERKTIKSLWPLLFFLWGLGIIVVYLFAKALLFDWYIPLYMIPILVASFVSSYLTEFPRNLKTKTPLFIMFLISTISVIQIFYASVHNPNSFVLFQGGSRVQTYLMIGSILEEEYPNAVLLTSEIGGLGYSFKDRILDAAGLASPDALAFHPMEIPEQRVNGYTGAIPPEYVKTTMPDIIVSYDGHAQALLNDDVIHHYNIIMIPAYLPEDATYSGNKTLWGNKYLRVYIHKTLPVSDRIYALGISQ